MKWLYEKKYIYIYIDTYNVALRARSLLIVHVSD
jgi:hypothetical protein